MFVLLVHVNYYMIGFRGLLFHWLLPWFASFPLYFQIFTSIIGNPFEFFFFFFFGVIVYAGTSWRDLYNGETWCYAMWTCKLYFNLFAILNKPKSWMTKMKSPKSLRFSCNSIRSIYMHLLSNLGLYVRHSSGPTISTSPKIINCIPSTKLLISFMLVFDDFLCTKNYIWTIAFFGSVEGYF